MWSCPTRKSQIERLFECFDRHLEEQGLLAMGGQIMDASIVEAPRQRNSQEEKETIKSGDVPKSWEDNPAKLRQKDCSARWTMKRGRKKDSQSQLMVPAFGYKSHININRTPLKTPILVVWCVKLLSAILKYIKYSAVLENNFPASQQRLVD